MLRDLTPCTFHSLPRFGVEISFVDAVDPANVSSALRPNTRLVWMETPTNPTLKLVDIRAVADIVKMHGVGREG